MKITRRGPVPVPTPPPTYTLECSEAEVKLIFGLLGPSSSSHDRAAGVPEGTGYKLYCEILNTGFFGT